MSGKKHDIATREEVLALLTTRPARFAYSGGGAGARLRVREAETEDQGS